MSPEVAQAITKHHIWSPERLYKTKFEKSWRNYSGFIVPVVWGVHDHLNHTVPHPPKPSRDDMIGIRDYLETIPEEAHGNPFWGAVGIIEYYQNIDTEQAHAIRQNIARQIGVLTMKLEDVPDRLAA